MRLLKAMSDFKILTEPLPDVFIIQIPRFEDQRGIFIKSFNEDFFSSLPDPFTPMEQFISISSKDVIRGMHFQVENSAQQKLVTCPVGKVLDVIVDVRIESPYFNKPISFELGEKEPLAILIGKGYAHGFLSLTDNSFMQYLTSTVHSPAHDKGVLWSSIDFNWPTDSPKISNRDSNHPAIGREICIFS